MELRKHPLVTYGKLPSWPPVWVCIGGDKNLHPKGEVGILTQVETTAWSSTNHFSLDGIQGGIYLGCLLLSDAAFCEQAFKLLQENIGRSIEDIGRLDLSYLE